MACITKSRARLALASSPPQFGWSNFPERAGHPELGERYNITVNGSANGKPHSYTTHLRPTEAIEFIAHVASFMTGKCGTTSQKLRALADKLER